MFPHLCDAISRGIPSQENDAEEIFTILCSNCSIDEDLFTFLETIISTLEKSSCEKEAFENAVRLIIAFIQSTLRDRQNPFIEIPRLDEVKTIDYMKAYISMHPEVESDSVTQKNLIESLPSAGSITIPRHAPIEYLRELVHQMNFVMGLLPEDHPVIPFLWVTADIVIPHAEIFVPLIHSAHQATLCILYDQIEGAIYRYARDASKLKDNAYITTAKRWSNVVSSTRAGDLLKDYILPKRTNEIPDSIVMNTMAQVVPSDPMFIDKQTFPAYSSEPTQTYYSNYYDFAWPSSFILDSYLPPEGISTHDYVITLKNRNHDKLLKIISDASPTTNETSGDMFGILSEKLPTPRPKDDTSIPRFPFEDTAVAIDTEFWKRFAHRGIVCAGGCALSLLINEIWQGPKDIIFQLPFFVPRDIDLFLTSPAENTNIIDEMLAYFTERANRVNANVIAYKTKHALNIELVPRPDEIKDKNRGRDTPRTTQIILRVFSCIEEVLMSFDQGICRIAWNGSRYFMSPCAAYCLANGFCVPLPFHGAFMSTRCLERLYNYDTRGITMVLPYTHHFRTARARMILDGLLTRRQSLVDRQDPLRHASVGLLSLMSTVFDRNLSEVTHYRISFLIPGDMYNPPHADVLSTPRLVYEMWQNMTPSWDDSYWKMHALKRVLQTDIPVIWNPPEWALSLWREKSKDRESILKTLYDVHGIIWDGQILTEEYLTSGWKESPVHKGVIDNLRKTSSDPWTEIILSTDDIPPPYYR